MTRLWTVVLERWQQLNSIRQLAHITPGLRQDDWLDHNLIPARGDMYESALLAQLLFIQSLQAILPTRDLVHRQYRRNSRQIPDGMISLS